MTIACGNTELNNEDIRNNTEFQMENHSKVLSTKWMAQS